MTEWPKLLRSKKRTIVSSYKLTLTVKYENSIGEYLRIGPFVIQKVLLKDIYIVRRVNTNKTQISHPIKIKNFLPNTPLHDNYSGEKLQPDDEIVIPQCDLYTISWDVDFDYELFETRKGNWLDAATRLPSKLRVAE